MLDTVPQNAELFHFGSIYSSSLRDRDCARERRRRAATMTPPIIIYVIVEFELVELVELCLSLFGKLFGKSGESSVLSGKSGESSTESSTESFDSPAHAGSSRIPVLEHIQIGMNVYVLSIPSSKGYGVADIAIYSIIL